MRARLIKGTNLTFVRAEKTRGGSARMTKKELIKEAAKLDGWEIMTCGSIRRWNKSGMLECPITAVANLNRSGGACLFSVDHAYFAGVDLGLSVLDSSEIVGAADHRDLPFRKELEKALLKL